MERTLRATVQYDGTSYAGFQRQRAQPTIQGTLEQTAAAVVGSPVDVVGAGRTDAGVHARGQVISFVCETMLPIATLERAINANLPDDIVVSELREAPAGFHARYDARSRAYEYIVYNAASPSPFWRRYAHFVPTPLNVDAMRRSLTSVLGEHDFASFGMPMERTRDGRTVLGSTQRTLLEASCRVGEPFIYVYLEADAFLRHMVRAIVGTLLQIGRGKRPAEDMTRILQAHTHGLAGPAAPARGLYLVAVSY